MKQLPALFLCGLLAACASPAPPQADPGLLHDSFFVAPAQRIDARSLFTLNDEMRRYVESGLAASSSRRDPRQALIDALYSRGQLRLEYDGGPTRTAAQAFEARAGNCLSLVIMTAAFAKHLGLPVSYRSVEVDETYSRSGDLFLLSGHVNLVLGPPPLRAHAGRAEDAPLTVDFLPPDDLRGRRTRPLQESTIVAMYMNNRAAEALSDGRVADGYWWAREAVLQDPGYATAANTLGVVYLRAGRAAEAEQALKHVLEQQPDNTAALSNLSGLLAGQGRAAEAQVLAARLARLQPQPPFHDFALGRAAMAAGDYAAARSHFDRELRLQPYQDEVHFWAALADWRLGNNEGAAHHLDKAVEYSSTRGRHDLYAAKLAWLRRDRDQEAPRLIR
jgi:Flp pilus assembly protein TadD